MLHTSARSDLIEATRAWLVEQGLRDRPPDKQIGGFTQRLLSAGLPVSRAHVTLKTMHPTFGGIAHRWRRDREHEQEVFARDAIPRWHDSPLYYMLTHHSRDLRVGPPTAGEPDLFPILQQLWADGATDYYATRFLFGAPFRIIDVDPENPPEGMFVALTSDVAGGFSPDDIADLQVLLPGLAVALKSGATRQMAHDLLATYLGPDAGGRVMSGEITRGSSDRLSAVILCVDLRDFTRLSQAVQGERLIAMLNTYFSAVVGAIEAQGGNVLKFMGDGLLAVFTEPDALLARRTALRAVRDIRARMTTINEDRRANGLPVTDCTMALNAGDVLYGNIGAPNRLDFTVIGPAVNTTDRLLRMCTQLNRQIVIADCVAGPLLAENADLLSLGRHDLRGVVERPELFTLA